MQQIVRKIFAISLDHIRGKDPPMSLGLASIKSNLEATQIDNQWVSFNVASSKFHADQVVDEIFTHANTKQHDVWIGAYVWNEPYVQSILKTLKIQKYPGRVGIAGPQISYVPASSPIKLEQYYPDADLFLRGYAESAMVSIAQGQEPLGLHVAGGPDKGNHAQVQLVDVPSPHLDGTLPLQRFVRWETRRGCPYRCSFCQHRQANAQTKTMQLDKDRISQEIRYFRESGIVKDVAVLDPTFNTDTLWATSILEQWKGFDGKLSLQIRPERINDLFLDSVSQLQDSGTIVELELGIQTMDPGPLKLIERIPGSNVDKVIQKVRKNCIKTKERNILTRTSLIFGLPEQTVDSFSRDVEWLQQEDCKIDAFPLMLLRGTPIEAKKAHFGLQEGLIDHPLIDRIQSFIPHVISSPSMSISDWAKMADIAASL